MRAALLAGTAILLAAAPADAQRARRPGWQSQLDAAMATLI